jgi:sulfotransferase
MKKTFFFMAGLPRSGSTLLSAILGQNPDIYTTPQTDMPDVLWNMNQGLVQYEGFRSGFMPEGYDNLFKMTMNFFYESVNKPYIIDKNRSWGTPDNLDILSKITDDIKIICPVRPILEIFASFLNLANSTTENIINDRLYDDWVYHYRPINDAKCEAIYEILKRPILSLSSILKPEHKNKFHFVYYEDLVSNPKETVQNIYKFLNIPEYEHDFYNINWQVSTKENEVFKIPELHKVKNKIKKSNTDVSILSDYIKQKYGNALDFLNDKKLN